MDNRCISHTTAQGCYTFSPIPIYIFTLNGLLHNGFRIFSKSHRDGFDYSQAGFELASSEWIKYFSKLFSKRFSVRFSSVFHQST
jgi:hypothetical protein